MFCVLSLWFLKMKLFLCILSFFFLSEKEAVKNIGLFRKFKESLLGKLHHEKNAKFHYIHISGIWRTPLSREIYSLSHFMQVRVKGLA